MDPSLLHALRLTELERHFGLYGVHVFQEGAGETSHEWRNVRRLNLYSGAKTFVALAVGICRDEGRLRLQDGILDFFPEYRAQASDGFRRIALRDLLRMASGVEAPWWFSADEQAQRETDWAELFFREPLRTPPGTKFFYTNANTYLLSRIVEAASGLTLRDYLVPRLFTPLGIDNPQWHTCPRGHTVGGSDLYLTTEEYARLGVAMLGGGVFRGRRIVAEDFVRDAVADTIENRSANEEENDLRGGYGYQLWVGTRWGEYRASGAFGQFCMVVPEKRAVVAVTAHCERGADDIVRAVYRDLLPRL